jgi:hypothetical protein
MISSRLARAAGIAGLLLLFGLNGCTTEMWNAALQGGSPVVLKNQMETVRGPSGLMLVFVYWDGMTDTMRVEVPVRADGTPVAPFGHVLADKSGDLWGGVTEDQGRKVLNWPAVLIKGKGDGPAAVNSPAPLSAYEVPKDDFISQTVGNRDLAMLAYRFDENGAMPVPLNRRERYHLPRELGAGEHLVIVPYVVHEPDPGQAGKVALAVLATPVTVIVDGVALIVTAPMWILNSI